MKVTIVKYFENPAINSRFYRGTAVTTKDCYMSTGYRGSGNPVVGRDVPAGTEVDFVLKEYSDHKRSWIEIQLNLPSDEYGRVELRATHDMMMSLDEAAKRLRIR